MRDSTGTLQHVAIEERDKPPVLSEFPSRRTTSWTKHQWMSKMSLERQIRLW